MRSPREMHKIFGQLRSVVFPEESVGLPPLRRTKKPRSKFIPHGWTDERSGLRINSFYQAPIGEENCQIKHIYVKPTVKKAKVETPIRPPSVDQRAQAVSSRFVRKVLFNHERTQRELNSSATRAHRECSLVLETVSDARRTIGEWQTA